MKKTVIRESTDGAIYRIEKIPASMFNFYIEKKRRYKDKSHLYYIGVELAADPTKCWTLDKIRGHKVDAVKRLEEIIRNS